MSHDIAPAIRRDWKAEDSNAELIGCHYSNVSFNRGLGNSGRKIETVEFDCPHDYCRSDRMVRLVRVNPESRDQVRYWCLYPGCQHFVGDELGWSRPHRRGLKPSVWQNTAVCPVCDERHSIVVTRDGYRNLNTLDDGKTVEAMCDECSADRAETEAGV